LPPSSLWRWWTQLARRLLAHRYPNTFSIFSQTRGPTRLALLTLAMIIVIPVAPLQPDTASVLARLLTMAVIGMIGWTIIVIMHIAAELYLRRFRLDVDDNFLARKHNTQIRVLLRTADVIMILVTVGAALMTVQSVRQYGISLFASAGVAGIIAGLAARPVLGNLMAGVQIAMTQPIRLYDSVIVEGEYGTIEEIGSTFVTVKLWDLRRPAQLFYRKAVSELDARAIIIADRECLSVCRLRRTGRSYSRQAHRNPQAVDRPQGRRHGVALPVERACARPNLRLALRGAREAH
jgi:hypothetical protein